MQEVRPPTLSPTSEPPPIFDGTTRFLIHLLHSISPCFHGFAFNFTTFTCPHIDIYCILYWIRFLLLGCTWVIHAHLHSAYGSLGTTRLFRISLFIVTLHGFTLSFHVFDDFYMPESFDIVVTVIIAFYLLLSTFFFFFYLPFLSWAICLFLV